MIACADAVRHLWEYLDGTVEGPRRDEVEEHLAFCRRCCGELEFAVELRALIARPEGDDLPDDVRLRLTETLDGLTGGPG